MSLIKTLKNTVLDAIFPIPPAEQEVIAMGAGPAFKSLPRASRSPVPEACSIFSYKDERVWRLIWSIKYKKSTDSAAIAGYALYQMLKYFMMAVPRIIVIPMPITKRRRRERGFNQCELIANEIEKLAEIEMPNYAKPIIEDCRSERQLTVVKDLLIRKRHTSRQTLKDRAERLESAQDIFAVNEQVIERLKIEGLKDCLIIIIDDVITTGGTIKDSVQTLRRAGFEGTYGLSVAH